MSTASAEMLIWPAGPRGGIDPRDRFAAYVAHELRTPIALQLALAEAALTDPHADAASLRTMAEGIVAACEHQERLIEALLDLTQSRHGRIRHGTVDVGAITGHALQACELGGLECAVSLAPAATIGDPTLLERLAANLVSNAIRHNIPHGRIEVGTRTAAGRAVLSVANTGPRIPAGKVPWLFQPFKRFGAASDGIGLGLAIVQSIADAHAATVAARPRTGGGLNIEVRFPRA